MANFRIHDLIVLLEAAWVDEPVRSLDEPTPLKGVCPQSRQEDKAICPQSQCQARGICPQSQLVCVASQLVKNIAQIEHDELRVLKMQLADALEVVAQFEFVTRPGAQSVQKMDRATASAVSEAFAKVS